MVDRVIYLLDAKDSKLADSGGSVELIHDDRLGELLAEGWEVTTTLPGRKTQAGKKVVTTTMMILRKAEDNRGVSVGRRQQAHVSVHDDFDDHRQTSDTTQAMREMTRALSTINEPSHLGGAGRHSMPGLTIVSATAIGRAFDLGGAAAMRGVPTNECPFPIGSAPATQWLRGYHMMAKERGGVNDQEIASARREGLRLARELSGGMDVVNCPYSHPDLVEAWKRGFIEGGGTVE